jgi:hypothetical protein
METCPFCEKLVAQLKAGCHIVPKWVHRLSFGKQSRTYDVDTDAQRMTIAQDGLKGAFWCEDCEKLFAQDDQYGSFIFQKRQSSKGPNVNTAPIQKADSDRGLINVINLKGVDFKKLQKFVLSVILREHMALAKKGKDLLGDKHFKKMKGVYFDDINLDDLIYPILINRVAPTEKLEKTVMQPYRGRNSTGANFQSFMGGGFQFHVVVQGHGVPKEVTGFRLKNNGSAIIPIVRIDDTKVAQEVIRTAKRLKRGKKN